MSGLPFTGILPDAVDDWSDPAPRAGELPFHELANLFPMMRPDEAEALRDDVWRNGLHEKIVLLDGQILDGRNRYRAALEAGLLQPGKAEPREHFTTFHSIIPGDALTFVLSRNLHRRHLSESQRAMVAARIPARREGRPAKRADGRAEEGRETPSIEGVSAAAAAEALKVGTASVERARTVLREGAPELQRAVDAGAVSVSAAADLAGLPVEEQRRIIETADPRALHGVLADVRARKTAEKKAKRADREATLATRQRALPDRRYGVILADPEWRFEPWSRETGMDRAPENHYPTSTLEELKARDVASIAADDCVLFLWATVPMLPDALEVMAAWGFAYKSHVVWLKKVVGTGYWFRNQHELLLLGTRGTVPAPALGTQLRSALEFEVRAHSQKPPFGHEIAERYFPNLPKIELNARKARPGWDAWGLEAPDSAHGENSGETVDAPEEASRCPDTEENPCPES